MRQRCTALAAVFLILATCWQVTAQVRDQPRTVSASQIGTISGRVEIEIDRQRAPVRRARVTLTADAGGTPATTTTDTDGVYRFERLAAGTYRIRAEKLGFVPMSSDPERPVDPPATIQIKAGNALTHDLRMQRAGALEGQFLDDQGHPVKRLRVDADRIVGTPARPVATYSATTDDLGRFRVHTLSPGSYHLRATPPSFGARRELYYPAATSAREAGVLTVAAGQTIDRLDFTVAANRLSEPVVETLTAPDAARVSGRVTRSDTKDPIANATVQLQSLPAGAGRTTRSNADGRFEFADVTPGSYLLTTAADGFVGLDGTVFRPDGSGESITVKERERIDNIALTLAPPGAIEGRALDEFGDPAPDVTIQVTQLIPLLGASRFVHDQSQASTGPTDDRGWFRVYGLAAGDYYLLAPSASLKGLMGGRAELPGTNVVDDVSAGFATTFFPGTDSVDAATPVRLAMGEDTRDLTFGLIGSRMVTINGVGADLAGRPASSIRVTLLQTHGGDIRTALGSTTTADGNGSFRFPGIPEGTYVLQGLGNGLFGSLPVTITTSTRARVEVTLALRPLITARGRLSFDGDVAPPRDPSSVALHFRPTDFTAGPMGSNAIVSRINPTGDFEIPNLAWKGVIRTSAPPGWLLKSVRLEGRDITDTPYDFQSADVNGLEVVLTSRLGTVAGTVVDGGKPAANVTVILFGLDESTWTYLSRFITGGQSDAEGAFTIRGVLPGRYYAVAVAEAPRQQFDAASLAALRPFATPIEVSEGVGTPIRLTVKR